MPKMGVTADSLERKEIPAGIYEILFKGFKLKDSKDKNSVNFNPDLVIVNNPELNGSKVFENLNNKAGFVAKDFVHAFGLELEVGADGKSKTEIPGEFNDAPDPANKEKWIYVGPLLGRTAKVEIGPSVYNGKTSMKPKKYFCAVPNCTEKHTDNLIK